MVIVSTAQAEDSPAPAIREIRPCILSELYRIEMFYPSWTPASDSTDKCFKDGNLRHKHGNSSLRLSLVMFIF